MIEKESIFINLSNHPSSTWEQKQIKAAQLFGRIIDISFPFVDPFSTPEQISVIADDYVCMIMKYSKEKSVFVHIMGEMTLSFAIIRRLQAKGISCYASTTERVVEEINNQQISVFKFVSFREYK